MITKKIENIDLLILDEDMDLKILIDYLRVNNKLTKNKLNEIIEKINNYDFCKECYKKIERELENTINTLTIHKN